MKDIVLFWVQWAGKWTQASYILEEYKNKLSYFEAWNILRALKSKPNCLWDYVKDTIDNWNLVSDEFISSMFSAFLSVLNEENKFALVDGFPRKKLQMDYFLENMNNHNRDFVCIFLDLDKDEAINRLSSRRVCADCWQVHSALIDDLSYCKVCWSDNIMQREDDFPEVIEKRLSLYYQETQPVIDYFDSIWKLIKIDASSSPNKVFEEIKKIL